MRILIVGLIFVLFVACDTRPAPEQKSVPTSEKVPDLSQELYFKLVDYQHKYPLPEKKKDNGLYVYEAFFTRKRNDTILLVWRSSEGVVAVNNEHISGVYKDDTLAPTIIIDSKDLYSKNFINKVIYDSASLKNMETVKGERYPESHPPIYVYKVAGTKLILNRIDTVWTRW